jgi:hypothetical protein
MDDKKTFDILLIKKIPYLTNGLGILCLISALTFIAIYSSITSDNVSPETNTFYLIETSTIKLLYGSGILTGVTLFLCLWTRQKFSGLIIFNRDSFEIISKKEKQFLPFSVIRNVYCNDTEDRQGNPNKKFTMTLETLKNKKILIRIKNTSDIKNFVDMLVTCGKLEINYSSIAGLG